MANDKPQGSIFPLILIIGAIWFFTQQGTPKPVQPDPVKPTPDIVQPEPVKPTPEQCWNELAKCVENKWIGGELQQHTDHLLKIVDTLKASGTLSDVGRVEPWRAKRMEITDANRSDIAKTLRGK